VPSGTSFVEPHRRRVQGFVDGRAVVDTEAALLVHRPDRTLCFGFLATDVAGLPSEPLVEAADYVTVPWDAVDYWCEEGRRLVHYPPSPYHRVDCRPTRRRLSVRAGATVLVDTDDTVILFETALAPRLYVSATHVRTDLLERTDTSTYCNYKGWASYWSVILPDGNRLEDVVWSYEDPLPESLPIKGLLGFEGAGLTVSAMLPG
jgi:uncharacterized protein (DUF427 family)